MSANMIGSDGLTTGQREYLALIRDRRNWSPPGVREAARRLGKDPRTIVTIRQNLNKQGRLPLFVAGDEVHVRRVAE